MRYDGALNFANQAHFRSTLNDLVNQRVPKLKLLVLQADTMSYIDASARATVRIWCRIGDNKGLLCLASAIGPVRDALAADSWTVVTCVFSERHGRAVRIPRARISASRIKTWRSNTMTKPNGLCNCKHTLV